ncbi:MAG: Tmc redox complex protein TmcD, partial [Desulfobacteraceae bacterium]|nr:Tmc redox complex protein TmcD [Desulfobacteraceae bacterium]
MEQEQSWDWQTPKKEIPVKEWEDNFSWTEEFQVSPDGEKIAAIVNKEEAVFTVCENGNIWEGEYEKAWSLKYSPDGRLAACVCKDEEWTVAVDGREWNTWFDYIWRLMFSSSGSHMGISVQKDMEYSMAVDDRIWDNLFDSLCESVISEDGRSAAVVQVESLGQADLEGFKKGIFSCAVNGSPLEGNYLNIWDISFNESGSQVAFAARLNRTDYTIVQEGQPWDTAFQTVWKPKFLNGGSCLAPVRKAGKWYLYKDGNPFWDKSYDQLWNLQITGDDQKIAA